MAWLKPKVKSLNNLEMMRLEKKRIMVRNQWKRHFQSIKEVLIILSKNLTLVSVISLFLIFSFVFYRWNGGLLLKNIYIKSDRPYSYIELLNQAQIEYGMPIENISTEDIRRRLVNNPKIIDSSLSVKYKLPSSIEISFNTHSILGIDENSGQWIQDNSVFVFNQKPQQIFPFFSCRNRQIFVEITRFMGKLQIYDLNAYRDIYRVKCEGQNQIQIEFNSGESVLILNPFKDPLLGFKRYLDILKKYPDELKGFKYFDLVNEGFLFAS